MSSFNQQQESKQQESKSGVEGEEQTKKKGEERTENSKQLDDLIIVQILSRLPVKSLLQFRCVCKSWCSLISDSHFVKTHLSCMSTEDDDYKHYRVIFITPDLGSGLVSCSLYSVLYEPYVSAFETDYPFHAVSIKGSCNGLLCISIEEDLFIWNPSIRKSKKLPDSGMGMGTYGFGYDESIVDYKVVGIFSVVGNGGSHKTQVKVYSLRTDTWRRLQDFPCGELLDSGKFANNALHWPVSVCTGTNYSWAIVALDLVKETYKEVAQPKYGNGDGVCRHDIFDRFYEEGDFNLTLGILRGCLCVLCNYFGTHVDVWVMKEYGVKDSWTKLVSIPCFTDPVPLCISKNGEILLEIGSLAIYDLKYSTFRYPSIHNFRSIFEVDTYVESLVSPSADNELQEYH